LALRTDKRGIREDVMAIIAMTREMATLGQDVAACLAERLGLDIVHHELVAQDIAERAGMRESEVQRFLGGVSCCRFHGHLV